MPKKFTTFILLLFSSLLSFGQFNADSIFIYKNFHNFGTTAMIKYNHAELDSSNSPKVKMDKAGLNELKKLFENERNSKYLQQKHGSEVYYLIVWLDNKKYLYVAETSKEFGRIINLTSMKQRKLNDSTKVEKLNKLITKNS